MLTNFANELDPTLYQKMSVFLDFDEQKKRYTTGYSGRVTWIDLGILHNPQDPCMYAILMVIHIMTINKYTPVRCSHPPYIHRSVMANQRKNRGPIRMIPSYSMDIHPWQNPMASKWRSNDPWHHQMIPKKKKNIHIPPVLPQKKHPYTVCISASHT